MILFESSDILWHLAEKHLVLMPSDPVPRVHALEYMFFQIGCIGPMFGQSGWSILRYGSVTHRHS